MSSIDYTINLDADNADEQIRDAANDIARRSIGIFDSTPYIDKAVIDGETADKLEAKFTGTWQPTVNDFNTLKLGRTITLQVEVEVVGKTAAIGGNGEEPAITGTAKLKVIDVYRPTPEQL